ncbi:MAG: HD domain-containing protein [Candidatus Omnitrophota bacterium]
MSRQDKKILDLISEAGLLKRIKRSGWWVLGIKDGESVAEHSFRCAVIGYAIAKMEGVFPYKILMMTLLGDLHEARINDLHKMAQRYVDYGKTEDRAFQEQVKYLPKNIKSEMNQLHKEYKTQKTKEGIIARDADILECLIQAKEYQEHGFRQADKFMKKAPQHLKTKSARRLWQIAKNTELNDWWQRLSEFRRI